MSRDIRTRVAAMYTKYSPEMLSQLDAIFFVNVCLSDQQALLDALVAKYGPEPIGPLADVRTRVAAMFSKYNPEKMSQLDDVIKKYLVEVGDEQHMINALVRKYGPEPPTVLRITLRGPKVSQVDVFYPTDAKRPLDVAEMDDVDNEERFEFVFDPENITCRIVSAEDKSLEALCGVTDIGKEKDVQVGPSIIIQAVFEVVSDAPPGPLHNNMESMMEDEFNRTRMEEIPMLRSPEASWVDMSSATRDYKSRLTRYFEHYNPAKVPQVDDILEQYKGNETTLFESLVAKYGPEVLEVKDVPMWDSPPTSPLLKTPKPPASSAVDYKPRLTRYFEHYNPAKVPQINDILEQYKGNETTLFQTLVAKYGPEPSTPASTPPPGQSINPPSTDLFSQKLTAFYQKFSPDDVRKVSGLVQSGTLESEIFIALFRDSASAFSALRALQDEIAAARAEAAALTTELRGVRAESARREAKLQYTLDIRDAQLAASVERTQTLLRQLSEGTDAVTSLRAQLTASEANLTMVEADKMDAVAKMTLHSEAEGRLHRDVLCDAVVSLRAKLAASEATLKREREEHTRALMQEQAAPHKAAVEEKGFIKSLHTRFIAPRQEAERTQTLLQSEGTDAVVSLRASEANQMVEALTVLHDRSTAKEKWEHTRALMQAQAAPHKQEGFFSRLIKSPSPAAL